jgi:hypothetical protein
MSVAEERAALAREIMEAMRVVSALGDRALGMGIDEVYFRLNSAWHKLDDAERLLRARRVPARRGRR